MSRPSRVSIALAAVVAVTLCCRVFVRVSHVRIRAVTRSVVVDQSSTAVPLPNLSRLSQEPSAAILRFHAGPQPVTISVRYNEAVIATARLAAGEERRIDASFVPAAGDEQRLILESDETGWRLEYVELASLHGYSRDPIGFVILPRGRDPIQRPTAWLSVVVFGGLLWLWPSPAWPRTRWVRAVYRFGAGAAVLMMLLALVSGLLTNFSLELSVPFFILCTALVFAPALIGHLTGRRWLELTPPAPIAPPAWREVLAVLLGLTVLVGGVVHGQIQQFGAVPDLGDPLFSIWRLSWVNHALWTSPRQLFDANIFYPAHGTLTYSDSIILPSLLVAPLLWVGLHPVYVYNVLLLSGFVLSGVFTYLLGRCWGYGIPASWVAGVIFALYPYRFDHYSHLELQMAQWIPLALLGVHRMMAGGSRKYVGATALAIGAQWYSSMYYGLFLTVYLGVFAVVLAIAWKNWRRLTRVVLAVALGTMLALPLALVYSHFEGERGVRTENAIRSFSATPADYLKSTHRSALYGHIGARDRRPERALFPGVAPILLGVVGLMPPLSATPLAMAAAGAMAFDGSLGLHGHWYPAAFAALFPFRSIRVPARFALFVGLSLALLAARGVDRVLPRFRRTWPALATAALLTVPLAADAWPVLELVDVWRVPPPIYGALGESSGAVLMEYPLNPDPDAFGDNIPFMYFSIWHWTPMINGYSGHISASYARMAPALEGFPGGNSIDRLMALGVTHVSVLCALDGRAGALGVPRPDPQKCADTLARMDARPELEEVMRAVWAGHPAALYRIRKR